MENEQLTNLVTKMYIEKYGHHAWWKHTCGECGWSLDDHTSTFPDGKKVNWIMCRRVATGEVEGGGLGGGRDTDRACPAFEPIPQEEK